jgi:hypothetical protein
MTENHTPTPWLIEGATVYALNEGGTNRMSFNMQGGWKHGSDDFRTTYGELEANAAFIVRACNAHADLVMALERLIEAWESYEDFGQPVKEAMAALARAKRP